VYEKEGFPVGIEPLPMGKPAEKAVCRRSNGSSHPGSVYDVQSLSQEHLTGGNRSLGQAEGVSVTQFPKYSIVIPAYNESARILSTLQAVVACIRACNWDAEVVVVNDGSTDDTAAIVRTFAAQAP
jgi:cellulose synthase/poly-beta-1,6-N-acetylglucosamine synthase-like glycosyltransferase